MSKVRVAITNKSFKRGYVDRVGVAAHGIKYLPYTIKSIEIDKDWIGFRKTKYIEFQVTVNYSKKGSALQTADPNIRNFPPLRFQLYDNKNNPVLDKEGKLSWFLIGMSRNLK